MVHIPLHANPEWGCTILANNHPGEAHLTLCSLSLVWMLPKKTFHHQATAMRNGEDVLPQRHKDTKENGIFVASCKPSSRGSHAKPQSRKEKKRQKERQTLSSMTLCGFGASG